MFAKKPKDKHRVEPATEDFLRPLDNSTRSVDVDDNELSLLELFRIFNRYRWVIIGLILLSTALVVSAAIFTGPKYRADTLVQPVNDPDDQDKYGSILGSLGGFTDLVGIDTGGKENRRRYIATLKSRQFTEYFIEQENLLPILFADMWDSDAGGWQADSLNDAPTLVDAYEYFDEKVRSVREDRVTGLVTLSITWSDPELAAEWANRMIQAVNVRLSQREVADTKKAISYLQKQLEQTRLVELQDVLNRLVESEMKKLILANLNEEFAFTVIDPAAVPAEPATPHILLLVTLGIICGALLGLFFALLLNFRRIIKSKTPRKASWNAVD